MRELVPDGVDATLELVGTPTLRDSLEATRVHGVVCSAGYLSNEWIVPDFYPAGFLPNGVRLTGYFGEASDLPQAVLQEFLDAVAAGEATVPIAKTYTIDEIATAHDDMEHDRVVARTVRPRRLARIAAVRPTDDVPPRISSVWPGCTSSPTVSAPYAVCSISGTAPSVVHGNALRNGIACATGTHVNSA